MSCVADQNDNDNQSLVSVVSPIRNELFIHIHKKIKKKIYRRM